MNRLSIEKRAQIIRCLVDGNSIRATVRITGSSKNTVTKLLVDVGRSCREYQDKHFRNLTCSKIQVDEIWSFCYAKQKNVPEEHQGVLGYGDVWTWTAICAKSKLVPSWMVGWRDSAHAKLFIDDLASRIKKRIQLTSDGLKIYMEAVEGAFGCDIDYAMLIKVYGASPEGEKRYSRFGRNLCIILANKKHGYQAEYQLFLLLGSGAKVMGDVWQGTCWLLA